MILSLHDENIASGAESCGCRRPQRPQQTKFHPPTPSRQMSQLAEETLKYFFVLGLKVSLTEHPMSIK